MKEFACVAITLFIIAFILPAASNAMATHADHPPAANIAAPSR